MSEPFPSAAEEEEEKLAATSYLSSLLNKILRVTTSDGRLFLGEFKCTDAENNIILTHTYEYRLPPPPTSSSLPPGSSSANLPPPEDQVSTPSSTLSTSITSTQTTPTTSTTSTAPTATVTATTTSSSTTTTPTTTESESNPTQDTHQTITTTTTITQDLTSRYLGLVVLPGEHITKIEVEEFTSQISGGGGKGGKSKWSGGWRKEGIKG